MLKREDKFAAGEITVGQRVRFTDAEGEEYPLAYEGEVVDAPGDTLRVRLTSVRAISLDGATAPDAPRAGATMTVAVTDVSSFDGVQRD